MRASGVSLRGVCLLLAALSSAAPAAAQVPMVARDVPLTGELDEGRTHAYRVDLREGEALRAVVEQGGIDVVVALRGPRGGIEVEMDGVSGGRGTEELAWEAAEAGVYLLEVQPRAENAPPGSYVVTVRVSDRADERQRAWISAERLFMDGRRAQAGGANLDRAVVAYESALAEWRRAGDRTWEGTTLQALGAVCLGLGRYDCARSRSEQALALHRSRGNRVGQGATLNNLGNVYRESGQYDRAQESYQQALAISRETEDRRVEAATLNNLASVHTELSQYERARERYEEALVIWREIRSRAGEAATLNNLGNVYQELGQDERARSYYEQTLAMSRQDGNRRAAGTTLNNLGNLARQRREYEQARGYYEEALRIGREVGDRAGEANVLNNLGELSANEEQSHRSTMVAPRGGPNARDFYRQALAIRRETRDRAGEEVALANLGAACRRLGDDGPAREYLTDALAIAREIKAPRAEAADLYELALLARHAGDLDLARAQVAAALVIVETIRSEVAGHDLRSSFLASTWTITPCPSTFSCSCIDGTGRPATTRPRWRRASAPMPEACSTCSRRREPRSARALPPRCSAASASCSRSSMRGRPPGSSSWPTSTRRKRRPPRSGSSRGSPASTRTSRPESAVPARDPRPCCNPGRSPWPRSRASSSTATRSCWCTGSARGAAREATSGRSRPDR
jgi:tetratricopeptide (TPR) repeat protein